MIHRRYDVYTKSLEATRLANALIRRFPPGYAWLADQLRRAIASAPLNIAEGLYRSTRPDRERFFSFARGSLGEASAALDVAVALGCASVDETTEIHRLIEDCTKMLWKLRS